METPKKTSLTKTTLEEASVDLVHYIESNPIGQRLCGRAVVTDGGKNMLFVENSPRGPRSVEIGRTPHSRYVRRPDGEYTLTFRVEADEKYLCSALQAEVRSICNHIKKDKQYIQQKIKQ